MELDVAERVTDGGSVVPNQQTTLTVGGGTFTYVQGDVNNYNILAVESQTDTHPFAGPVWDPLRVIDEDGSFLNPTEIDAAFERWGLGNVAGDYAIIAIEGPQSSGKSEHWFSISPSCLLLNSLFRTKFEVMDPSSWQQTTKGIWMARVHGTNMIILDVEGSDSRERHTRGDPTSERKMLAFTLAHANVLMVNVWKTQLSGYNRAGLPLLQIILERNIQLFSNEIAISTEEIPKKILLFIIRDNDNQTPLNQLTQLLRTNLEHVWETIQHNGRSLYDYFQIEFHSFPHYVYLRKEFDGAVLALRNRFHSGSGGLLTHAPKANVPITTLSRYMQLNHEAIQTDEAFNLPSQRQIILERHVDDVAKKKLAWLGGEGTRELRRFLAERRPVDGLGSTLRNLFKSSLDFYVSNTADFNLPSAQSRLDDFRHSVLGILKPLYLDNLYCLQASCEAEFSAEMSTYSSLREFLDKAERCKVEKLQAFIRVQNDAVQPDWIPDHVHEDLIQRLDSARDTGQVSPNLQPMTWSQEHFRVGSDKYMTAHARLHGDGRLVVEIHTECDDKWHGLWGRMEGSLKDKDGALITTSPVFRCTTRGGVMDIFTASSGWNSFSHQFSLDVPRRTTQMDIRQWDSRGPNA